jgi:predicted SnoaL-like aldol condensation-catalyzing enzyme
MSGRPSWLRCNFAEGDMVVTHSRLDLEPGNPGRALADFFRLEDGKVVEHWDVIQDVPAESANDNGMFLKEL